MNENFNKKRATFKHKGKTYEIDELMDAANRAEGFGEYDIFDGTGISGDYVGHICAGVNEAEDYLIEQAKIELNLN